MELQAGPYRLRPLLPADASDRYVGWMHDPTVNRTLDVDGPSQTLETVQNYIAGHDNVRNFLFGIFTEDGVLIGTHSFRYNPQHKLASVGVMIGDRDYWGKEVPLATRSRILDFAFDDLGCNKVEAGSYSINLPAIYNFKRQHWKLEGVRKAHRIVEGKSVDVLLFGMLKEDWYARR